MQQEDDNLKLNISFDTIYSSLESIKSILRPDAYGAGLRGLEPLSNSNSAVLPLLSQIHNEVKKIQSNWNKVSESYEQANDYLETIKTEELFVLSEKNRVSEERRKIESMMLQVQLQQTKLQENLNLVSSKEEDLVRRETQLTRDIERMKEENTIALSASTKDYVRTTMVDLRKKEDSFLNWSKTWGVSGAILLALAFSLFVFITLSSGIDFYKNNINFSEVFYHCVRGLIAVGILGGLSRYCYLLSSSFMKDSLKFGDRRHAISFGGLYLESFGAFADWSHVKDAFSNWNMSSPNDHLHSSDLDSSNSVSSSELFDLVKILAEKLNVKT